MKYAIRLVGPLLLLVYSCTPKNTLYGVWGHDAVHIVEYHKDGTFRVDGFKGTDSARTHTGTFTLEPSSTLVIHVKEKGSVEKFHYDIKNQVLLLVCFQVNDHTIAPEAYDSSYLHRDATYCEYKIEQLYKYGKIVNNTCDKPYPFIYFNF